MRAQHSNSSYNRCFPMCTSGVPRFICEADTTIKCHTWIASHRFPTSDLVNVWNGSLTENITITHKFNKTENHLGVRHICVDGWDVQNKIVHYFHRWFLLLRPQKFTQYLRNEIGIECE
ncbi:hypothetical protein PoB_002204700 [Plakobranchus ocellatus]|uniref:Uncharacterized protein n=1 Tax=Plakobranchus ocellatus TaxID=259542 RepID=A0AAV3ZLZ6_9GAST|nr:hypothetical protein PoB_002204700 [Plakobranchus ocellatus]